MELSVDKEDLLKRVEATLEKHTAELEASRDSLYDRVLEALRQAVSDFEAERVFISHCSDEGEEYQDLTRRIAIYVTGQIDVADCTSELKQAVAMYSAHVGEDVRLSPEQFSFLYEGDLSEHSNYCRHMRVWRWRRF